MTKIIVTDEVSGNAATIDQDSLTDTIRHWFAEPPAGVTEAIEHLQRALDRGEYTGAIETYLGIRIERI
jgi:hypothetical protein